MKDKKIKQSFYIDYKEIAKVVKQSTKINIINLNRKNGKKPDAIKLFVYLCDKYTNLTQTSISNIIKRKPCTVSVALKRANELREIDKKFKYLLEKTENLLKIKIDNKNKVLYRYHRIKMNYYLKLTSQ